MKSHEGQALAIQSRVLGRSCMSFPVQIRKHLANLSTRFYSFRFYFMSNPDKAWLTSLWKATSLSPVGTFYRNDDVSLFLQSSMIPWGHMFYFILKKYGVLLLRLMVWLIGSLAIINELSVRTKGDMIWQGAKGSSSQRYPYSAWHTKRLS